MKRTSGKTQPRRQWALFGFIALTMFLLAISSMPSAAQKAALAGWEFEIEEGKKLPATLEIVNICKGPHRFRIKSDIKYLTFGEPTDGILAGPASTRPVKVLFDATGLKSKTYHDKVVVECLDCKQEQNCLQDREELAVEMTVIKKANREDPNSLRPDVTEKRVSGEQLGRVTNNEKFKEALEVVAAQNEAVDLKTARLLTSPRTPGMSAIKFGVTVKGTNKPGEYARLVYMEQTGVAPVVFFDEKRTGSLALPNRLKGNEVQRGGGRGGGLPDCSDPFLWKSLGSSCENDLSCPSESYLNIRRATFDIQTGIKACPGFTVSMQRIVKVSCGC